MRKNKWMYTLAGLALGIAFAGMAGSVPVAAAEGASAVAAELADATATEPTDTADMAMGRVVSVEDAEKAYYTDPLSSAKV